MNGIIGLDSHIESPKDSDIFKKYPQVLKDVFALELITDSFRMLAMNFENPHDTEDLMNRKIKKHYKERMKPAEAIHVVADGLPAIGIVAAVLGVIKTMGSIDQPPEILGAMIGGALVGTFMGVYLAYCMVSPIHGRLAQIEEEDTAFYHSIRDMFVALVSGHPPNICAEIGRSALASDKRPSFDAMEDIMKSIQTPAQNAEAG